MIVSTKKTALLVALIMTVLLVPEVVARTVNRPGSHTFSRRRRLQDTVPNRIGRDSFHTGPYGAGQTAFEYCKAETINEKATELQKDIPFFKSKEHFIPMCKDICVDVMDNSDSTKYISRLLKENFCATEYPGDFRKAIESLGFTPPEDQENGICGCIFRCDFMNQSLNQCLHYCVGNDWVLGQTTDELGKWCKAGCPDDDPLCVDACECALSCEDDREDTQDRNLMAVGGVSNPAMALEDPSAGRNLQTAPEHDSPFHNCVAECKSSYNGYEVYDFLHEAAIRLSECMYENKGCEAVEDGDWNNDDGCSTVMCFPNPDYNETAEWNGENYEVLRRNLCHETQLPSKPCPVGAFCAPDFEVCPTNHTHAPVTPLPTNPPTHAPVTPPTPAPTHPPTPLPTNQPEVAARSARGPTLVEESTYMECPILADGMEGVVGYKPVDDVREFTMVGYPKSMIGGVIVYNVHPQETIQFRCKDPTQTMMYGKMALEPEMENSYSFHCHAKVGSAKASRGFVLPLSCQESANERHGRNLHLRSAMQEKADSEAF